MIIERYRATGVERGIIFSGSMVRALIELRKRQTRRLASSPLRRCVAGDRLWVREAVAAEELKRPPASRKATRREREHYGRTSVVVCDELDGADGVRYLADDAWVIIENSPEAGDAWHDLFHYHCKGDERPSGNRGKTVPAIHMPRWASRLTLIVGRVWTHPLQAISREDCAAEGHLRADIPVGEEVHLDAARDWYMDLWDSLHDKDGERWRDNPLVVAIEFEVRQANIDRLG